MRCRCRWSCRMRSVNFVFRRVVDIRPLVEIPSHVGVDAIFGSAERRMHASNAREATRGGITGGHGNKFLTARSFMSGGDTHAYRDDIVRDDVGHQIASRCNSVALSYPRQQAARCSVDPTCWGRPNHAGQAKQNQQAKERAHRSVIACPLLPVRPAIGQQVIGVGVRDFHDFRGSGAIMNCQSGGTVEREVAAKDVLRGGAGRWAAGVFRQPPGDAEQPRWRNRKTTCSWSSPRNC